VVGLFLNFIIDLIFNKATCEVIENGASPKDRTKCLTCPNYASTRRVLSGTGPT
jgi:hypothetical protein